MDTTVAPLASIGVDVGKEVLHLVGLPFLNLALRTPMGMMAPAEAAS
jgi:hypothetical protein